MLHQRGFAAHGTSHVRNTVSSGINSKDPGIEAATTGGDRHVADKTLTCSDCNMEFAFTEREQAFYAEKGFSEPRRCPTCRASRKAARSGGDSGYGGGSSSFSGGGSSYDSGYGAGGGYSAGGYSGGGFGNRGGGPREMFTATCSSCGREARVPFRPTNGKPVYCSDCFRSQRGG
jgi:CxxC-x17-CxxC domain-containing protein